MSDSQPLSKRARPSEPDALPAGGVPVFRGTVPIVFPLVLEVQLPVPVPAPVPEPRNHAAYSAFALRDGTLRPFDDAALAVLETYCQVHPSASVSEIEIIEGEFLRVCQPLPEVARGLYDSLVLNRSTNSAMVELQMGLDGLIGTQLAFYNVPAPLHLPLFRRVAIRLPTPEIARARWAFTGVLLALSRGYAVSLVRTYASFLADARWVCPYAFRSPNASFWALAVYSAIPAHGLHPYLAVARTYNVSTSTTAVRDLAKQATAVGDFMFLVLKRLHSFLAALHALPNMDDDLRNHPDLAGQAIADVLDWA